MQTRPTRRSGGCGHVLSLTELVSKIQVFSEAAPAGLVPLCFPLEAVTAHTKYNKRKTIVERGVVGGEGKGSSGVGVGCCSYTHFKARLGLSGRIAVKSLYESDL